MIDDKYLDTNYLKADGLPPAWYGKTVLVGRIDDYAALAAETGVHRE